MLTSIPLVGRLFSRGPAPPSARLLPAVAVHHTETDPEKRVRTLKYLLKGNHVSNALVSGSRDETSSYNDVAYLLYAVYMMGGSPELLNSAYSASLAARSEWAASPAEIARVDWRDFLGQPLYQHAYVDFFEDILAEHSVAYNWHTVVQQYLLGEGYTESSDFEDADADADADGDEAETEAEAEAERDLFLRHCLLGAGGAPILHLACAFELDSPQLAMEGLALAASTYREDVAEFLAELGGAASAGVGEELKGASLRAILEAARSDGRLAVYKNGASREHEPGYRHMAGSMQTADARAAFVAYWRAWDLAGAGSLTPKLKEAQRVFAELLVDSASPRDKKHSRALSTVLAVSHGVRVLLPFLPAKHHLCIMQQWWLLALAVYLDVGLPAVPGAAAEDQASSTAIPGKDWKYVSDRIKGWHDQAYMMTLHSIRAAAETWPDAADVYLAAAARFVDDFEQWSP